MKMRPWHFDVPAFPLMWFRLSTNLAAGKFKLVATPSAAGSNKPGPTFRTRFTKKPTFEAERLGGFEIDFQLDARGLPGGELVPLLIAPLNMVR